jgi:hypothetical protein
MNTQYWPIVTGFTKSTSHHSMISWWLNPSESPYKAVFIPLNSIKSHKIGKIPGEWLCLSHYENLCLSHEIPWHPIPGESSGGAALTSHGGRHRRCATWQPRQLYLRPLRLLVSWLEHVQQTAGCCFLSWKKYGENFERIFKGKSPYFSK